MVGEVVGRDQLCDVIIDDVIDPRSRRPHVIVGGVGTGKTALLERTLSDLRDRIRIGETDLTYSPSLEEAAFAVIEGASDSIVADCRSIPSMRISPRCGS